MVRLPVWAWMGIAVLLLIAVAQGVAGITFQWACDDYAEKKAAEAVGEGFRPYDTYTFVGLGIGFCSPGYSD